MLHARRTWLWRLRRASLLLLLGLGTTVAVAWAAEVWSKTRWSGWVPSHLIPSEWFVDVPSHWPVAPVAGRVSVGIGRTDTIVMDSFGIGQTMLKSWRQEEVRVGFPLRSLRRVEFVIGSSGQSDDALHLSRFQTGLPLPAWLGFDTAKDRRLPLLPLWPGLVANTLIYGLLWWLGLAARRMVICNRRFRRGLCPICRYDLGFNNTAGCPECGWRRE